MQTQQVMLIIHWIKSIEKVETERKRKAHPSLLWKGTRPSTHTNKHKENETTGSLYTKHQKRANVRTVGKAVPPLFALCVDFLVQHFESVERLGDVDNLIRTAIANQLIAQPKMNETSFRSIAEGGIEALELVDCSGITQDELSTRLSHQFPAGLRYLVLEQCGRCMGPKMVQIMVQAGPTSSLFALAIAIGYLLKDDDAASLIQAISKTLSSLELRTCPRLGIQVCMALSNSFGNNNNNHLLEMALEDLSLDRDALQALVANPQAFQYRKNLSLRRIEGLTDDIVTQVLQMAEDHLEGLDLTEKHGLTDASLSSIRQYSVNLRSLSLANFKHLTETGLEALFTFVENMTAPPMLRL